MIFHKMSPRTHHDYNKNTDLATIHYLAARAQLLEAWLALTSV